MCALFCAYASFSGCIVRRECPKHRESDRQIEVTAVLFGNVWHCLTSHHDGLFCASARHHVVVLVEQTGSPSGTFDGKPRRCIGAVHTGR